MKEFLIKMQVYKSTADISGGKHMFDGYSLVNDYFLKVRQIVLANKVPRKLDLQGHLSINNNQVTY